MIEQTIKEKVASILKVHPHELDSKIPLTNFGIDSLKAIEIQTFIEEKWKITCRFESILNDFTIFDIISIINSNNNEKDNNLDCSLNFDSTYSLSYQQMGIRRFSYSFPDNAAYNIGKAIEIHSSINVENFELSLKKMMEIHPVLNTLFIRSENGEGQTIRSKNSIPFKHVHSIAEKNLEEYLNSTALQAFDLDNVPLFRVILIEQSHMFYILQVVFHHIIADLWSIGIFFDQLFQIYQALSLGNEIPFLNNLNGTYEKFVQHQQTYIHSEKAKKDLDFWLNVCQNQDSILNLPIDYPRKNTVTYSGGHEFFTISSSTSQKLKKFAQKQKITPFGCLLAAFELFIHYYSGQTKFFIGTTLPGRPNSNWHSCFGLFANILPVQVNIESKESFSSYINRAKQSKAQVFEHSEMPFTYLLDQLSEKKMLKREPGYSPIFQVMFVYQQVPSFDKEVNSLLINENNNFPLICKNGVAFKGHPWNIPVSPFELTLYMNESNGEFQGNFEYNTDLFHPSTIQLAAKQFIKLLDSLLEDKKLSPSSMLTRKDKEVKTYEIKSPETIISLFDFQLKSYPDRILLVDKNQLLTVRAADAASTQAAGMLIKYNVQYGSIVAVLMDHSSEMVIILLAIMKLGAIFLPLDHHMPQQRIKDILDESQPSLMISDEKNAISFRDNVWIINPATFLFEINAIIPKEIKFNSYPSSSIAYIIYTSGSTGKPKGIAVSNEALISYFYSITKKYKIKESSHWALYSPISFDLTLTSLFLPIINKHTLHIFSRKITDTFTLFEQMLNNPQITHIKLTPSHLKYVKEIDIKPLNLKQLIVGGEQLAIQLVDSIWNYYNKNIEIINEYGPTEATIGTIFGIFPQRTRASHSTMLLDECLDNADFLICNYELDELPLNMVGELFLSGTCLAYGYWNRTDLTSQAFIPHPGKEGKRMYRTGDLIRQLPDHSLLLLGRADRQIKINGFRIELEEIEKKILEFTQVKMCVVVIYDKISKKIVENLIANIDPVLCAYIVENSTLNLDVLQQFLAASLPYYMRPSHFVLCSDFTLSVNGKIDLKLLPDPGYDQYININNLAPPQTPLEEKLQSIWCEILRMPLKSLGINHHFFELGGDSISVINLVGKCKSYGLHFTPQDLYEHPTIQLLAGFLENTSKINSNHREKVPQIPVNYYLSPIQKNFFATCLIDPNHYNQAVVLKLKREINVSLIKLTFEKLLTHHDILRSIFLRDNREIIGHIQNPHEIPPNFIFFAVDEILLEKEEKEVLQILQEKINIETGPIICAGLYKNNGEESLLIVIHHLVIDGVSWRIFLEDFDIVYTALLNGLEPSLLFKTDPYPLWINKIKDYFTFQPDELQFWNQRRRKRNELYYYNADRKSINHQFSSHLLEQLSAFCQQQQIQINDILLAALTSILPSYTGNSENFIDLEFHGRNSFSPEPLDLTRTLGWFTSIFPIQLQHSDNESFENLIKKVKNTIEQIPNRGLGYQIFSQMKLDQGYPNLQSSSICFNYLGQFDFKNYINFDAVPILEDIVSEKEQTPYNVEIIAYLSEKVLNLTVLYDSYVFNEKVMHEFVENLQNFLVKICERSLLKQNEKFDSSDLDALPKITKEEIEDVVSLSPMQKGILFDEMRFPGEYYLEQAILEFIGEFDENIWKKAFEKLISQSETLRTVFVHQGLEKPKQIILKNSLLEFEKIDGTTVYNNDEKNFIDECIKNDKKRPFNLSEGPLMRITCILLENRRFTIVWSFHHIILDGWSLGILFKTLMHNLNALYSSAEIVESYLGSREYYHQLDKMDKEQARNYYRDLLMGYQTQIKLPKRLDLIDDSEKTVKEISSAFSDGLIAKLCEQAQIHHVTLSTLLQTSWGLLIASYSNCTDVVFGMVSSGRTLALENIESIVGMFISTLPVRVNFDRNMTFVTLCKNIQKQIMQTQQYLNISLSEIQSLSPLKQNLIDHLFIFENYPLYGKASEIVSQGSLPFHLNKAALQEEVPYNLSVTILPDEFYRFQIKFNPQIYTKETIEHLANNWQFLLKQIVTNYTKPVSDLSYICEKEEAKLHFINDNEVNYPLSYIHSLFENQEQRTQDRIAIIEGNHHVTYRELNRKASILAIFLQNLGFGAEDLIGIFMERSIDMVIAWLAILKAGSAYTPLNINDPINRLEEIITGTNISLILTHQKHHLPNSIATVQLDVDWAKIALMQNMNFQKRERFPFLSPKNLAYVIFTSGSTGKPKGIAMEHASVMNHINWLTRTLSISESDRILQCTDFSFDITICSFYALFAGGVVVLTEPEDSKNMGKICLLLKQQKISLVQLGASLFGTMIQEDIFSSSYDLKYILCGGSPLKKETIKNWYHSFNTPILNLYGPTETCIDASFHRVALDDANSISIPIGKFIDNTQGFILNNFLDLVPINAHGELYIGGAGLARGYHLRPDLTAQAFLPHLNISAKRMYKTGDICSWNYQLELILHGRLDHQIKIRGLRVELKEIENVLTEIEDIKEAFIHLIGEGSNQKIIAYVISKAGIKEDFLKINLSKKLPTYMIPSFYVFLEKFPLNERQKIDISLLPLPIVKREISIEIKALTTVEKNLQSIWANLLGLKEDDIHLDDNFFDLGGNSLHLMQMQNKIDKAFSKEISLNSFFQYPSIRTYAHFLIQNEDNEIDLQPLIEKRDKQKEYRRSRKAAQEK